MKTSAIFRALGRFVLCCGLLNCLFACQSTDDATLSGQPSGDTEEYLVLIAPLVKCMNLPRPTDAYNYPIYPGMATWATLSGTDEMIQACQIPVSVVRAQSTQALIQDIWEYPFFSEPLIVTSSTSYAQAVANSTSLRQLNAYRELIDRKDNIAALLNCYQAMDPLSDPLYYTYTFEALLTTDDLLPQITTADKKTFIRIALQKDGLRKTNPNHSDIFQSVSWYFIGKLLQTASYAPFEAEMANNQTLARFLDTSSLAGSSEVLKIIDRYAKTFIK